jgi:succinate dehydrogenase / fumarate reductase membrane anchor subunit
MAMVKNVTSLTRNGLRDWLVQRVSALVMLCYTLFLLAYCLLNPTMDYIQWQTLFATTGMRVFSLMVLFSLILHSWVGMWTISTDYLKSTFIRFAFQVIVALTLLACLIWGVQIFWGV